MYLKYVTVEKFSEMSGYTKSAIQSKITKGVWLEGEVWTKADDGRRLIIIEGFNRWVENDQSIAA